MWFESTKTTQELPTPTVDRDIAISAVPYDAALVSDLTAQLAPRLWTAPAWAGHVLADPTQDRGPLLADSSRLTLVLHQRLWGHDDMTRSDAAILRDGLARRQGFVRVITLDDTPVPAWLDDVDRCDLTAVGLDGVIQFVLAAITSSGGWLRDEVAHDDQEPAPFRLSDAPPFLAASRAHSALQRELASLGTNLKRLLDLERAQAPGRVIELHLLPNRFIARLDDVGVSFSWIAGRSGTVADGSLMVIEWNGVASHRTGVSALKAAVAVRERMYRADAMSADVWAWRDLSHNGRACSTANLAAELIASAQVGSSQVAEQV